MTYKAYIQSATADGYSLRYSWIRIRMPNRLRGSLFAGILLLTIFGCERAHQTLKDVPYAFVIYGSVMCFFVLAAIVAVIDRPRKLGFVEFAEDEIRFVRTGNKVERTFAIDQINYMAGPGIGDIGQKTGDSARDIASRQLTIVMRGGERFRFECLSAAFFTARHEPVSVTLEMLSERVSLQSLAGKQETDF